MMYMSKNSMRKDSTRYYRQTDFWRLLGAGLMIAGLAYFWLGRSMLSYYIPCVITPAGLILFLVFSGRYISDNDMAEEREHRLMGYDHEVTERADFSRYVLKQPADVETEGYHMGDRAAYFKRSRNGSLVSDRFVKTHFFFTKDALLVCSRELSMTVPREEAGASADTSMTLFFDTLTSARLCENQTTVTLSNTKKAATAHWMELVIEGAEGELLRLPVKNDMDMSNLCEELTRKIKELQGNA